MEGRGRAEFRLELPAGRNFSLSWGCRFGPLRARAMIVGVGTDIVSVDRIAAALERFGERFRNRVYTECELALADRLPDPAGVLAKRWAAKEACSKALGTGLRQGVALRDIMVETVPGGMPEIRLVGKAQERLAAISPRSHDAFIHVSMTDDRPWAAAIVVIEARPPNGGKA